MPKFYSFPNLISDFKESNNCDENISSKLEIYPEYQLPPLKSFDGSEEILHYTSDIYDLLNQERLNNLGRDTLDEYLSRNPSVSSELSEQISKLSDEEILQSIKPRNLQSAEEIRGWIDYLQGKIDDVLASSAPSVEDVPSDDGKVDVPLKDS